MSLNNLHVMERLRAVMLNDANSSMETLLKVIRSDIFTLLSEYMVPEADSLKVEFEIDNDGMIGILISAKTNKLIEAGYTI